MTDPPPPEMHHSKSCPRPGISLERGYSCTIRRCLSCGAVTAERHLAPQPKETP